MDLSKKIALSVVGISAASRIGILMYKHGKKSRSVMIKENGYVSCWSVGCSSRDRVADVLSYAEIVAPAKLRRKMIF